MEAEATTVAGCRAAGEEMITMIATPRLSTVGRMPTRLTAIGLSRADALIPRETISQRPPEPWLLGRR